MGSPAMTMNININININMNLIQFFQYPNVNFNFNSKLHNNSFIPFNSHLSFSQFHNSNSNSNFKSNSKSTSYSFLPKAFSTVGEVSDGLENTLGGVVGQNDLLIVGPGVLGRLVAQQWRQEYPGCKVYGQTATSDHHGELVQLGIEPSVKGTSLPGQFSYVIFCAPPSKSLDYAAEVREAFSSWNGEGSFVFTSSSAPYDCTDNGYGDEDTPVVPVGRSPRTDVLLKAENVVLEHGGCVLRLAGLYKADRGAHTYWLNQGTSELRPDHFVNLIHYEDAASLAIAIMKKGVHGRIFLGCDSHPLSRQEIMDLVNGSGKFSKKFQGFTGTDGVLGKRLNNTKTREELGWQPKYASFAQFLEAMQL